MSDYSDDFEDEDSVASPGEGKTQSSPGRGSSSTRNSGNGSGASSSSPSSPASASASASASPKSSPKSLEGEFGALSVRSGTGSTIAESVEWEAIDIEDIEFGNRIGGGGFAIVYEGWWRDENVALKAMFDPRAEEAQKQEYMDELHVMSQVNHPHIVRLLGACTRPPKMCMVMELCETSLFDFLHKNREHATEVRRGTSNVCGGGGERRETADL